MNDFVEVKSRVDIVDYIQQLTGQQAKLMGSVYGLPKCPFDDCQSKSGFRMWKTIQGYKCYACNRSGDVFSFSVEYAKSGSRFDALKEIAQTIGYGLSGNGEHQKKSEERVVNERIFNEAADFYTQLLLSDKKALKILQDTRKYNADVVKAFGIGYTGNKWNLLKAHLAKKGYSEQQMLDSGLVKDREGKVGDYFVPRLFVFPHRIGRQVCDFTIKDSLKHQKPKGEEISYRLSKKHRIGDILFFNQDALYQDEIVLVEGEHDAIQPMVAGGKKNVVAICGQFEPPQKEHLKKVLKGKTVYLAFDPDKNGEEYTKTIFELSWGEAKLRVVNLKGGPGDIDVYLRKSNDPPKAYQGLLDESMECFRYIITFFVDEVADLDRQLTLLEPYTKRLSEVDDLKMQEVCLEALRGKFDNPSVAKIIEKELKEKAFSKQSSGANQQHLPCYEDHGIYWRKHNKGAYGITNFVLRINDVVLLDEEIYYRCTLINDKGDAVENVVFDPSERSHARKFRERVCGKGAYYFTGSDSDLAAIWQFEESRGSLQKTFYVQHFGWVKKEQIWLFDNCAIKNGRMHLPEEGFIKIGNRNYQSYDVLVYSRATPRLNLDDEYTPEFAQQVADSFHKVLDTRGDGTISSYKGYMFFGFLPAVVYAEEIYDRFGFFPFLFSYGPSGTGKTVVTQLLLSCFGFACPPESWDSATKDGTHKFLQHLGSMPCWYDEFLNDDNFKQLLGTLKNIYIRAGSGKGGIRRRQVQEVNGCLWLSGEDNPANEAVLSRSVIFRFDPINPHKTSAYRWLEKNRYRLSVLFKQLLMEKTEQKAKEYTDGIEHLANQIMDKCEKMESRVARNHAIPAAGMNLMGLSTADGYIDYIARHAEKGLFDKLNESPIYQFFSELAFIYNRGPALNQSVKWNPENGRLSVHFESAIKIIQKELRFRNDQLRIKPNSVKDYLKDLAACEETGFREYFPGNVYKRCMVFNYDQLPENIKDAVEFVDEKPDEES